MVNVDDKPARRFGAKAIVLGTFGLATAIGVSATAAVTMRQGDSKPAATRPVAATQTEDPAALLATVPATTPAAPTTAPATPSAPPVVAKLTKPVSPTGIVVLPKAVTAQQLAAIRALPAVTAVTTVDVGSLGVNGKREPAIGVDAGEFRRFTPGPSAKSDALWQSVASGYLIASYGKDEPARALLGKRIKVGGNGTRKVPLGGIAAFGLDAPSTGPYADVVVDHQRAQQLGLATSTGVLFAADPASEPGAVRDRIEQLTGGTVTLLGQAATEADDVSGGSGKPTTYEDLDKEAAATCPGLSWTILAAIGEIESGDGANDGPSSAGAIGPMQFLPATFNEYAVDGDHDGKKNPYDPFDAVPTAARMLCANGAGQGGKSLRNALFAYNHAEWYVDEVLDLAARYRA